MPSEIPTATPRGIGPTRGSTDPKINPAVAYQTSDLSGLSSYMLLLMLRNIASDGFVFGDPAAPGSYSAPGCVIAAPSYPANTPGVDQDYVFNWVRDAAITMIEVAEAGLPPINGRVEALGNFVAFATTCYNNAQPTKGHASFTIAGQPRRDWSEQSDGPALQTLALLRAHGQLDGVGRTAAIDLVNKNVDYLLGTYQQPTTNLWEEHSGLSFFARAVQLKCFREIAANTIGVAVPAALPGAIAWLETALGEHWNGGYYVSLMVPGGGGAPQSVSPDYDANIDIVQASIYGSVPCDDTRMLATAGVLLRQWSDNASLFVYPINQADSVRGIGPVFGRYPGDVYDGDTANPVGGGHPWALCTANFAELLYTLATTIVADNKIPHDDLSGDFFGHFAIAAATRPADAATALRAAADAMLRAILFHSDGYELSEQFDARSGYEKSVRNLTWSYAAFLSALRARAA